MIEGFRLPLPALGGSRRYPLPKFSPKLWLTATVPASTVDAADPGKVERSLAFPVRHVRAVTARGCAEFALRSFAGGGLVWRKWDCPVRAWNGDAGHLRSFTIPNRNGPCDGHGAAWGLSCR